MSVLDETTLKDKKMNDISVGIASIDDCGGGGGQHLHIHVIICKNLLIKSAN